MVNHYLELKHDIPEHLRNYPEDLVAKIFLHDEFSRAGFAIEFAAKILPFTSYPLEAWIDTIVEDPSVSSDDRKGERFYEVMKAFLSKSAPQTESRNRILLKIDGRLVEFKSVGIDLNNISRQEGKSIPSLLGSLVKAFPKSQLAIAEMLFTDSSAIWYYDLPDLTLFLTEKYYSDARLMPF